MRELIITNVGRGLVTRLIEGTASARFTRVAVSDHAYSEDELCLLTELSEIKQTVSISKITRIDGTVIELLAAMENTALNSGYFTRALGVYAKDENGTEILFAVCIEPDMPYYMPPYSGKTVSSVTYRLNIKVDRSENVMIDTVPGAYATVEMLESLEKKLVDRIGFKTVAMYERDPSKPNYLGGSEGGGAGDAENAVTLNASGYTGTADIAVIMSDGVVYDAENMSRDLQSAENGSLIIKEV